VYVGFALALTVANDWSDVVVSDEEVVEGVGVAFKSPGK
jgi:hypothetical protein